MDAGGRGGGRVPDALVHVDVSIAAAVADQLHELALGHDQGGVRHHVQEADMKLAAALSPRRLEAEDGLSVFTQRRKRRQGGVLHQRHQAFPCVGGSRYSDTDCNLDPIVADNGCRTNAT